MPIFLRVAVVVILLIAALFGYAASKPNTLTVRRTLMINAPLDRVFGLVNDFHNWHQWAPQDKDDPTMVRAFSGPTSGKGAASQWDSKGRAGKGRMLIVESEPTRRICVDVDFLEPFETHNENEFVFESVGTATNVTWTMHGTNLLVMKLMSIFVNMDKQLGAHFENGLQNLKAAAES
ncbi:MAG TPA: SRPBCC family protein [Candidatus Eremiobacteraceae bacterium]|nr:SRPBCC family protein [Candidatus Eremiobacteraceae bacterium]